MIILQPPTYNPKDKQRWAKVLCCGVHRELHDFAKRNFLGQQYFDAHYFLTIWLLDGHWHYQSSVNLQGAYWITPAQFEYYNRQDTALLFYGKSRRWELCERGLYSNPAGVIPQRAPVIHEPTGVVCGYNNPPDPQTAELNRTLWNASAEYQQLTLSIETWIETNLGQSEVHTR